jgi:GNAT superfamily N-acetyltransferase
MNTIGRPDLAIRPAIAGDVPQLTELYTDLATWRFEQYGINDWPIPFPHPEVGRLLESSDTYIAYLGSIAVGTIAIEWQDEKIWGNQDAEAVYVHRLGARLHGAHIGAALLNHAAKVATDAGIDRIRLDCNFADKKLCSHYESLGFTLVDTKWIIPSYEAARYERKLA